MTIMIHIIFFVYVGLLVFHSLEQAHDVNDPCKTNLIFKDCKDQEFIRKLSPSQINHFEVKFESECPLMNVTYQWQIFEVSDTGSNNNILNENTTQNFLSVKPSILTPPDNAITVTVFGVLRSDANKIQKNVIKKSCLVKVDSEKSTTTSVNPTKPSNDVDSVKAVAFINGGTERTVPSNEQFLVDGSKSTALESGKKLNYLWTCTVQQGTNKDFCHNKKLTESKIEVPGNYAINDYIYIFTLSIQIQGTSDWTTTNQTVKILLNAVELDLICTKNCPPASPITSAKSRTSIKVKCIKNCPGLTPNSYIWTIEQEPNFDYKTNTQYGRNSDKFYIKANVLQPGRTYKISLAFKNAIQGSGSKVLTVQKPLTIKSCQVKPLEGVALSTKFKVSCDHSGNGVFYEIYTVKNEKKVFIGGALKIENLQFVLPQNVEVFIRIKDTYNRQESSKLAVNVKSRPNTNKTKEMKTITGNIEDLLSKNDISSAVQRVNGITDEIAEQPELKKTILESFKDVSFDSRDDALQVASILSNIVENLSNESDPDLAEIASKLCRKAAEKDLEFLQHHAFPATLADEVQESTEMLMKCGEANTEANFKIVEPKPPFMNITTPFPPLTLPVIEENYQDYIADYSPVDKTNNYAKASKNLISLCRTNAKRMGIIADDGDEALTVKTNTSIYLLKYSSGKDLTASNITIYEKAFLQISDDLKSIEDNVNLMVCLWKNDPFWWNSAKTIVATDVVSIEITNKKNFLTKFQKPNLVTLSFDYSNQEIQVHEIDDGGNLTVIRVDVGKNERFVVQFHNLTSTYHFRVLITSFRKPNEEEIRNLGNFVSVNNTILYQDHNKNSDAWYYVNIVGTKTGQFKYMISIYTSSCQTWNINKKQWEFACKGHLTPTRDAILCECFHLSILAGTISNNRIKIEKVITMLDFFLELILTLIIFISISFIFLMYCVLITVLVTRGSRQGKTIYVPADITPSLRYVYLVKIRTGGKLSAGRSKCHVLNYPDPDNLILKKANEDWFVVPTQQLLGNVNEMELWSDYSGLRPTWFCANVTIYDLQSQQKWFCDVNKWLDLPPKSTVYIQVKVPSEKVKRRLQIVLKLWPRRRHQASFTHFFKLTLVLSIILTIFMVGLCFYGLPRLEIEDGLVSITQYQLSAQVFLVGLGAGLIAALIHMPMVFLLRRLSSKFKICCWCFLIVNIVGATSVLVVFGFWVPLVVGLSWLTSVVIAIVMYFLIFEQIYETIFITLHNQNKDYFPQVSQVLTCIELQRSMMFENFDENLLRPYLTHLYQPLSNDEINEKQLKKKTRVRFVSLIEDIVMIFCYILLLYMAIFANKNDFTTLNHQEMTDIVEGSHARTHDFFEITSIETFYNYVNNTLIPNLHATQWYSKFVLNEPAIMIDFHNKVLGVARLRQRRLVSKPCTLIPALEFLHFNKCRSEFWIARLSTKSFKPDGDNNIRMTPVWDYTPAKKAGYSVSVGKFGVYPGGGFVAPLGRTLYNSYVNLFYLKNATWLDFATGVILIEFLTYNVNTNLFNAVKIIVENSATGFFRIRTEINTVEALFVNDKNARVHVVIFGCFSVIVIIFTLKILARILKRRFLVFQDLWILIDLLIIGLSYSCFVLLMYRNKMVKDFLDTVEKAKKNEFVNYFDLINEDVSVSLVAAFLVFVATIRLWKLCRVGKVFRVMERTLTVLAKPIMAMIVCHFVIVVAFGLCGFILFGTQTEDMKDFGDTLITTMLLTTSLHKHFDITKLIKSNSPFGYIFYCAFMLTGLLFTNLYIAVIMLSYYEAQEYLSGRNDYEDFWHFLRKNIRYYNTSTQVAFKRLKAGAEKNMVIPKSDEIRYANCLTCPTNTLDLMRYTVLYEFTSRQDIMLKIAQVAITNTDANEIFFCCKTEKRLSKLIHDNKIIKMAQVAEAIIVFKKKRMLKERKHRRKLEVQLKQLDHIQQVLATILQIVSNIEVD